jgi:4-carboxymuconolactone decarboxylase
MPPKKPVVPKKPSRAAKSTKAKELKGLEEIIGKVPVIFKDLAEKDEDMYHMVMRVENHVWGDGTLTRQTKKLIAIAIAAALRDPHAVRAQLAGASKLGIKKEEVEEALRVTFLLSGMPAYVYGKAAMEEIMKK